MDIDAEIDAIIQQKTAAGLDISGVNDWYAIGIARSGRTDLTAPYLADTAAQIEAWYGEDIGNIPILTRQRALLTLILLGGNPSPSDPSEQLIADAVSGQTEALRDVNQLVFGLLAYGAAGGTDPEIREDLLRRLTEKLLPDGGFALNGTAADPDMTAMALTALAPYRNCPDIPEAVEAALDCLSARQLPSGGFRSFGTESAESSAQLLIALTALEIDPLGHGPTADRRFIKDGRTLLDGIAACRVSEGRFAHSPGLAFNDMATAQVLCGLVALRRFQEGLTPFYQIDSHIYKRR